MKAGLRAAAIGVGAATLVLSGVGISWAAGGSDTAAKGSTTSRKAQAVRQVAVASPPKPETVFVPITPCRVIDTRVKGGPVSAARSFYVAGTANVTNQGGRSGGCGIPSAASAVSANVVATGATKGGFVKGYPAGAPEPGASIINYGNASIANGLALAIRPGTAQNLTLKASSPVQLVVDITGYYAPQIEAFVDADGTLNTGTARVATVTHTSGSGVYTVRTDSDIYNCSVVATTTGFGSYAAAVPSGVPTDVTVRTWTLVNGATTAADQAFNVIVAC